MDRIPTCLALLCGPSLWHMIVMIHCTTPILMTEMLVVVRLHTRCRTGGGTLLHRAWRRLGGPRGDANMALALILLDTWAKSYQKGLWRMDSDADGRWRVALEASAAMMRCPAGSSAMATATCWPATIKLHLCVFLRSGDNSGSLVWTPLLRAAQRRWWYFLQRILRACDSKSFPKMALLLHASPRSISFYDQLNQTVTERAAC